MSARTFLKLGLAVLIASAFSLSWTSAQVTCNGTITLASADVGPNPGSICGGSYLDTHTSDDVDECLQEGSVNGVSHLSMTWEFDNVPAGTQYLIWEGHRPTNNDGDNFKFSAAYVDPNNGPFYLLFPGAVIQKALELQGGTKTLMGTTSGPYEWYIYLKDTAAGANLDSVYIDYLAICTESGA